MNVEPKPFTLLEILIATIVMAIGMLGILAVFPTSMELSRRSEDMTMAAMVAKRVYADQLYQARENSGITTNGYTGTPVQVDDSDFYVDYKIDQMTEAPFFEAAANTLFYQLQIKVYVREGTENKLINTYDCLLTDKVQ